MESRYKARRAQLFGVMAAVGAGLLMLFMVTLAGVSMAAGLEGAPLAPAAAPSSTLKIGDYVWYDANANGRFDLLADAGEEEFVGGIDGVIVNLYRDANSNNQIDPGELMTTTVTGEDPNDPGSTGWYQFEVQPGATYIVQVDPANFTPGGALFGMAHTSATTIGPEPRIISIPSNGTDRFDIDFGYVESGVTIDKRLLNPSGVTIYAGDTVAFRVVLTNTGHLTLTTVPLWDYYSPACLTFVSATITPTTVDAGLGILYWSNVGPLAPNKGVSLTLYFLGNSGAAMYWKEGGWPDYAPKGIPDFSQKQDQWGAAMGQPPTWRWSYCGPTAAANSLWWFDSKFEINTLPPPTTISDTYPLVRAFGAWDDHDARNVEPLVATLAALMGTNPVTGTHVSGLAAGITNYISATVGSGQYSVTVQPKPLFSWVASEVRRSEDVMLLLGFWQIANISGQQVPFRIGGHYVTVAGVNALTPTIAFSDPFTDRAEIGWPGRAIPNPHLSLHTAPGWITDTVHNDAAILSHDAYTVTATSTPGGTWGPYGYIRNCSEAVAFKGQNEGDLPNSEVLSCNDTLPVFAEVEYAVAVSPITPTVMCSPTVNIAVASGVIDVLGNHLRAVQDESPVTIVEYPTAVVIQSLEAVKQHGWALLPVGLLVAVLVWKVAPALRRRPQ